MARDVKGCLDCFERLAELHKSRLVEPHWKDYLAAPGNPWLAMKIFLIGYAFERQGRSEDYSWAAGDTVARMMSKYDKFVPCDNTLVQRFWKDFCRRLESASLNHKNNPCCPLGTKYITENKGKAETETSTSKPSVIEFLAANNMVDIVHWTKTKIAAGTAGIRGAHEGLCTINGIGVKIASLFLRDICLVYKCSLPRSEDRRLLQPVDVWIRFVIQLLADDQSLSDEGCADYIIRHAQDPEAANTGIWYFCARACESSRYKVRESLNDMVRMKASITDHLESLIIDGKLAESQQLHWRSSVQTG